MKPITRFAAVAVLAAAAAILTVGPAAADPVTTEGHTSPTVNPTVDPAGHNAETKGTPVVGDILAGLRVEIKNHDGTLIPLADVPSLKIELENADIAVEAG